MIWGILIGIAIWQILVFLFFAFSGEDEDKTIKFSTGLVFLIIRAGWLVLTQQGRKKVRQWHEGTATIYDLQVYDYEKTGDKTKYKLKIKRFGKLRQWVLTEDEAEKWLPEFIRCQAVIHGSNNFPLTPEQTEQLRNDWGWDDAPEKKGLSPEMRARLDA